MNHTDLLQELEPLAYDARVQRMIALHTRAQSDPTVATSIAALERGDFSARWLALQSCHGSRDGAHVLRAIADPSQSIRSAAQRLAALICDDAQVAAALDLIHPKQQHLLLKLLAKRRRHAPIDAFLLRVEPARLPQLLPYASAALVARLAAGALPEFGFDDWRRLAIGHPELAAEALALQAQATTSFDQRLLAQANVVLPQLAERAPNRALALIQALLPHISLAQLELQALAFQRPAAIVDLLLQSGDQTQLELSTLVRRLDQTRLRALLERGLLDDPEEWLPRLRPELRRSLYELANLGWRDDEGALRLDIVAALPGELRVAEARRNLALPALATRPSRQLPYAAYLPWDEACSVLDTAIRNPDPTLRALALPIIIGAARYDSSRLADALRLVTDRRNEQDPVRMSMLWALSSLPPSRWQTEHLLALGQAIRDALDAADCSHTTASAAENLVIALLPFHPDWSAQWLATLIRERGQFDSYELEQRLTKADVRQIAPTLLPVLEAWQPRERDQTILHTARMFGKRLDAFPELVAILEQMTHSSRGGVVSQTIQRIAKDMSKRLSAQMPGQILIPNSHAWVASQALQLIAEYQYERLPALIPALVQEDPSWVTQPIVYDYLHRRRQDLLTPFLGQTAYHGQFSTGKTRFVLPLTSGFYRWTSAQQTIFARILEQVTRDSQRESPALFMAIKQLAALPALEPMRMIELAQLRNKKIATRDVALRALGQLDAGQGIATLLAALDDDRARIAIYALRRALLQMPAAQALELLRGVPMRKVTVAKEVVRLMGELPGDTAYADLLAMAGEELHRDVHVALLRALWDHLEQPATWPILERAAMSDEPAIATGVIHIPADRRSPAALLRLVRLLVMLLANPAPKVRLDTLRRCATLPIADPERALQAPLLAAIGAPLPDERAAAASAVFATYAGRDADLVGDMLRQILPNRRALVAAIGALQSTLPWNRSRMLPGTRAALAALATDPLTATFQVELAIGALLWEETIALLRRLAAEDLLHAEVVTTAITALETSARRAAAEDLAVIEQTLTEDADARLRRIALAALIALAQPPRGWDAQRIARLQRYRADTAPLVAAAAQFIFPADEE